MSYALPGTPCAEVVLALHGVGCECNEDSRGDDECFENKVDIKVGHHCTNCNTFKQSLEREGRREGGRERGRGRKGRREGRREGEEWSVRRWIESCLEDGLKMYARCTMHCKCT